MYNVLIKGFKTQKQAEEFLNWYEGGGEQQFYDHLDCVDMSPEDGCNINVYKDYKYDGNTIVAEVE